MAGTSTPAYLAVPPMTEKKKFLFYFHQSKETKTLQLFFIEKNVFYIFWLFKHPKHFY